MKISFAGRLADVAGTRELERELPDHVRDLVALSRWVGEGGAELEEALRSPGVRVLVNDQIRHSNCAISEDDEIAFLPVLSGG
jgi:molybdopterin converting factor small subunit